MKYFNRTKALTVYALGTALTLLAVGMCATIFGSASLSVGIDLGLFVVTFATLLCVRDWQ